MQNDVVSLNLVVAFEHGGILCPSQIALWLHFRPVQNDVAPFNPVDAFCDGGVLCLSQIALWLHVREADVAPVSCGAVP